MPTGPDDAKVYTTGKTISLHPSIYCQCAQALLLVQGVSVLEKLLVAAVSTI